MILVTKTIQVEPGGELDRLLDEAIEGPIVLERKGIRYRLDRLESEDDKDIWAGYDPEKALAGMEAAAGFLSDEEAERLREYVYEGRELGTRPDDSE
jgi:hypothetical protein